MNRDGIDGYARWIRQAGETEAIFVAFEFRRVPSRFTTLMDRAFDYARKEVGEYHMRLVEELAERYDFDGLELDLDAIPVTLLTEFTLRQ